jgi:hypothetical protein
MWLHSPTLCLLITIAIFIKSAQSKSCTNPPGDYCAFRTNEPINAARNLRLLRRQTDEESCELCADNTVCWADAGSFRCTKMNFVTVTATMVSRVTTTVTYGSVYTEWKTETLMDVIGAGTMVAPTMTGKPAVPLMKRQFSKPPTEWTNTITKTAVSMVYVTKTTTLSDAPYSTVVATKTISIPQKTSVPTAEATPNKSERSVGAIVGGIVGGVIFIGLIIAFALILARRRTAKAAAADVSKNGNKSQNNSQDGNVLLYDEKGIYPPIGAGSDHSEQNLGVRAWLADADNQSNSPIQQLQRASNPNRNLP